LDIEASLGADGLSIGVFASKRRLGHLDPAGFVSEIANLLDEV